MKANYQIIQENVDKISGAATITVDIAGTVPWYGNKLSNDEKVVIQWYNHKLQLTTVPYEIAHNLVVIKRRTGKTQTGRIHNIDGIHSAFSIYIDPKESRYLEPQIFRVLRKTKTILSVAPDGIDHPGAECCYLSFNNKPHCVVNSIVKIKLESGKSKLGNIIGFEGGPPQPYCKIHLRLTKTLKDNEL